METLRLAALTHLHSLGFDELGQLAPAADELWIPAGRRVLLGGPLHHALVLIAAGRGLVRCAGETVAELGPGDVFGELSTRRPTYATATVLAATPLHLVVLTRAVRVLRDSAPEAVEALLAACSLDAAERATALAGPRSGPVLQLISAAAASSPARLAGAAVAWSRRAPVRRRAPWPGSPAPRGWLPRARRGLVRRPRAVAGVGTGGGVPLAQRSAGARLASPP